MGFERELLGGSQMESCLAVSFVLQPHRATSQMGASVQFPPSAGRGSLGNGEQRERGLLLPLPQKMCNSRLVIYPLGLLVLRMGIMQL